MENRECRDILFCLLFTASVLAMAAIAIYGFSKGAPNRLLYPYDPFYATLSAGSGGLSKFQ